MRVGTRVALGAALLVGLLFAVVVRNVALLRDLAESHRRLGEQRIAAVTGTLEVLRLVELIDQRLQKYVVTRDPAYRAQLDRHATTLAARVETQLALGVPEAERLVLRGIGREFSDFRTALDAAEPLILGRSPEVAPARDAARQSLVAQVGRVRAQSLALLGLLRSGIEADVVRAEEEALRGEEESWWWVVFAGLSGLVFAWVTWRSLNGPLAKLLHATRSVGSPKYARLSPTGADELAELGRAFDTMVDRLDEVDRTKREFLSSVSHELKTPLAAMQETTNLMLDGLAGPLTDKQRRMLDLNRDAGRRLSIMLSRLLDLARLEAGAVKYDKRRVDVGGLLADVHQEFESRMREKRIASTLHKPDAPAWVEADRDWMLQVFENLVENALKFSPEEKTLQLALARHDGPHPRLPHAKGPLWVATVADEGPGLPEDAKAKVFERFFQVGKANRSARGVGLGLAICKDVIQAHGGAVWVDNRPGGGAIFSVALPVAAPEDHVAEASQDGSRPDGVRGGAPVAGLRDEPPAR